MPWGVKPVRRRARLSSEAGWDGQEKGGGGLVLRGRVREKKQARYMAGPMLGKGNS